MEREAFEIHPVYCVFQYWRGEASVSMSPFDLSQKKTKKKRKKDTDRRFVDCSFSKEKANARQESAGDAKPKERSLAFSSHVLADNQWY